MEYASDNKHPGCPARMADGRLFTDYRPSCSLNGLYPSPAGGAAQIGHRPRHSHDMRQEFIRNAGALLRQMRGETLARGACVPCAPGATVLPHSVEQACDVNACDFRSVSRTGLGTKRAPGRDGGGHTAPHPATSRPCTPSRAAGGRGAAASPLVDFDLV